MTQRARRGAWLSIAVMLLTGCAPAPEPPPDAPADVYSVGGKTPRWQHCTVDPSDRQVHCKIWTKHHLVRDEVFIPYDGGPTPAPEELRLVDVARRSAGIDPWIFSRSVYSSERGPSLAFGVRYFSSGPL